MNIITGYRAEPHITSAQDRAKNQGAFGVGSYILDVGRMLEAEIISANEIRIRDGVLSHQGCVATIESGAYDTVEISSGSQGMQRIDLIVARYTKDAETNIEDIQIEVIEGTPAASDPTVPSYYDGDIQTGDSPVDMPLYQVNISGITISSCTLVAQKIMTQAELNSRIVSQIDTIYQPESPSPLPAGGSMYVTTAVPTRSGYTRLSSEIYLIYGANNGSVQLTYTPTNGSLRMYNGGTGSATVTRIDVNSIFIKD